VTVSCFYVVLIIEIKIYFVDLHVHVAFHSIFKVTQFQQNPFTWSNTTVNLNTAVLQIVFRNKDNPISIANLTQAMSILLPSSVVTSNSPAQLTLKHNARKYVETTIPEIEYSVILMFSGQVREGRVDPLSQIIINLLYIIEETNVTGNSSDNVRYIDKQWLSEQYNSSDTMVVATPVLKIRTPVR
jgi:hypothetical protein